MTNLKYKIIIDGTVLAMGIENKLARTGVYFVIENLCKTLFKRTDVDLRIIANPENTKKLLTLYKDHDLKKCFDLSDIRFGKENLNFINPFHPVGSQLYKIENSKIIQIIYDFSHHFCPELKFNNKSFEKKILESINKNTYALCISKKTKEDLLSLSNIPKVNVDFFYPGLRNDLISQNKKNQLHQIDIKNYLNIPQDSQYILCLSTIEPRKNLKSSLKIFEQIIKKNNFDNLYLILSGAKGWGRTDDYFNNLSYKVKSKIKFTGYVEDIIVPQLYRSAICFLYPSFYEGFGLPPLEAMSYGTPVVTSDRGSLPEVFGEIAHIFDPYDIDGMSGLIIKLFLNQEINKKNSYKLINFSKRFSWDNSSEQIIKFIKKINN